VTISEDAQVSIVLADYAAQDGSGKINIIGAGWGITGLQPTGLTPELAVVAFIELPPRYRGERFATCVKLVDEAGDPVTLPGPGGNPQALRVQQLITVDPPMAPGIHIPGNVPSLQKVVLRLGNGLPLSPNQMYKWICEVDGTDKASIAFYIAGPPPPPVIG